MGLFDVGRPKATTPNVKSMLPQIAQQEILNGRLPILKTQRIFLESGEICHYMDNAVYEKEISRRKTVKKSGGYSVPGLFKGTRIHVGEAKYDTVTEKDFEHHSGILYITNKRILFVGDGNGFEEKLLNLVAATPYLNCIQLQMKKSTYRLFVSNGNIPYIALQILKQ